MVNCGVRVGHGLNKGKNTRSKSRLYTRFYRKEMKMVYVVKQCGRGGRGVNYNKCYYYSYYS